MPMHSEPVEVLVTVPRELAERILALRRLGILMDPGFVKALLAFLEKYGA